MDLAPQLSVRDGALPGSRMETVGGRRIHLVDRGTGPAVLLVHGLNAFHYTWRSVIDALADRFRLIAPDLPGCGFSDKPEDFAYDLASYAGFLDELLDRLKVARAHVVGHSLGGAMAELLARRRRERVDRLVLVGPSDLRTGIVAADANVARNNLLFAYADKTKIDPVMMRLMQRFAADLAYARAARLMRERNSAPQSPAAADCRPLDVPCLLVWGAEDRIVPVAAAETMRRYFAAPALEIIAGTGHACHEEAPEHFAGLVDGFLAGNSRVRPGE